MFIEGMLLTPPECLCRTLEPLWEERLDDMLTVKNTVIDVLDQGLDCSQAWFEGLEVATELGHADHLMGMVPDQSTFLGHSVGLNWMKVQSLPKGSTVHFQSVA